jgi:hypothetical protein
LTDSVSRGREEPRDFITEEVKLVHFALRIIVQGFIVDVKFGDTNVYHFDDDLGSEVFFMFGEVNAHPYFYALKFNLGTTKGPRTLMTILDIVLSFYYIIPESI